MRKLQAAFVFGNGYQIKKWRKENKRMKLNYKKTIFVGFAFFLICAFWQAYDSIVPMMLVNKFGLNQTSSGVIMALDNVLALFLLPLFGSVSDKTKTKLGKRTPYVLIGTIVATVFFTGMTFADNLQLNKLYENKNSAQIVQQIWDENVEVSNAEKILSDSVAPKFKVRDYASLIKYNKNYDLLTAAEKADAEEWFKSLTEKYTETYDYENGVYSLRSDGKGSHNAYTNLVSAARNKLAWQQTKTNPLPLVLFFCALLITLLAMSLFRSPAVALMPDVTVKPLRSKANAVINLLGTAGGVIVLLLGKIFRTGAVQNQMMKYTGFVLSVCGVMLTGLCLFMLKVRENKWAEEMKKESEELGIGEEENKGETIVKKLDKEHLASLILILASVALWYMGYNAVTSKYSLYATNYLHKDYNTTLLIAQAAAIITYVPVGFLAQKIGRRKSVLIGVAVLFIAFGGAIFVNSSTPAALMYVFFALAGIGWATINVNSFPMVVELSSGGDVGKFTGYYYTASMAAQIFTPVLSGLVMDSVGSYAVLFPYAVIFVALSFVTMFFVKFGDSKPERKKDVLEMLDVNDD